MRSLAVLLLSAFSMTSIAGELYYSKSFTASQEAQVKKCFELDSAFPNKVKELTSNGDIALTGMIMQASGPLFFTKTNAYGSWMEFKPLQCDFRTQLQKEADAELKHQRNLEAAKAKVELDLERFEQDELAKKRAAELEQIEMEAAAELKLKKEAKLKQQQLASEKRKAEAQVLAKRHHADAIDCVSNDSARVKKQLLARLHDIHRPDALHVEDQKISKVKFLKDATIMEVSYTFKLFSQTKYKSGWGSKSEPNTLKSTGDIKVKPYSRSSAKATCALPST
ncbi:MULTISPECIES: hypothetical protein [unclassified Vibrio]|uniref:hypothetical protein n=1 Tax=unclassified Vibrio TaxID=2614977 RepID=UPI003550EE74